MDFHKQLVLHITICCARVGAASKNIKASLIELDLRSIVSWQPIRSLVSHGNSIKAQLARFHPLVVNAQYAILPLAGQNLLRTLCWKWKLPVKPKSSKYAAWFLASNVGCYFICSHLRSSNQSQKVWSHQHKLYLIRQHLHLCMLNTHTNQGKLPGHPQSWRCIFKSGTVFEN